LDEARLIECRCKKQSVVGDKPPPVSLLNADLRGVDLRGQTVLAFANFRRADMRGARFDGATLYRVRLDDAKLAGASFAGALLASDVFFDLSDLRGASFDQAIFRGPVIFAQTCLSKSSFVGTDFGPATSLVTAYGRDIDLRDAENLSNVQTSGAVLIDVRFDKGAARPKGWDPTGTRLHHPTDPYAIRCVKRR
jgi:uncharacterized protein YjbI with pentapeptide repeats